MIVGVVGGTGKEGRGLALRWAKAGHDVRIGSRDDDRGRKKAEELTAASGVAIRGGGNTWAAAEADVVVLSVPYSAHEDTLISVKSALADKIVVDITVPLRPPKVRQVHLPAGQSAAMEAQKLLDDGTRVVAALHHVSSAHLGEPDHAIDCDVLVCGDDDEARKLAIGLIEDLGLRGLDAGPLRNAVALEALTPVLLHLNKRYGGTGAGIRVTGLPEP